VAFVYKKRSPEEHRRRLRVFAFEEHIIRAYRGETGPLREYLQSDLPLSQEHREQLAELVYWRIQNKGRGKRGKGAPTFNPDRQGERLIAYEVRKLKEQRYGNRRAPRGTNEKLT
jgi:hypothetical protein